MMVLLSVVFDCGLQTLPAQEIVNKNAGWGAEWTKRLNPQDEKAALHKARFQEAYKKDRPREALEIARRWVAAQPEYPDSWSTLRTAALWNKQWPLVITAATEELKFANITPLWKSHAYGDRALARQRLGQHQEAVADFRAAFRDVRDAGVLNSLAWLLATSPDPRARNGREAVEVASEAVRLKPGAADIADTLAAAYAEAGDFKNAVAWQIKAQKLATLAKPLKDGAVRRKLYEKQHPYRETN